MKHGHTSKGYDMPWDPGNLNLNFSGRLIVLRLGAWCLVNWWPSNLHFFAKLWRHAASCAFHSDPRAEHSALTALSALPASPSDCGVISMTKSGLCCITSNSGPRSAMPQRMNLTEIEQEVTISYIHYHVTIQCFVLGNNVKNGVSWIHGVHFEVANMPNIPTHSPEIPLRRKFSFLSASVVWSSSVSARISAASCSPQFSICISLAPLRSSPIASSFLGGAPYNQHHHHSRRSKKNDNGSLFGKMFRRGFLKYITSTEHSIHCLPRQGKLQPELETAIKKNAIKGQPANLKMVTENTQSIPTTLWDHTTCTIASWFVSGVPFTAMCVSLV